MQLLVHGKHSVRDHYNKQAADFRGPGKPAEGLSIKQNTHVPLDGDSFTTPQPSRPHCLRKSQCDLRNVPTLEQK